MAEGGITVALASAGIICLIAAVIGGGLKGLGFDLPALQSVPRQMLLGGLGIALLGAGLVLRGSEGAPKSQASATPTPIPIQPTPSATAQAVAPDTPQAANTQSGTWKAAQTALQKLGYYAGPVDGMGGARTIAALRRFQTDAHLPADGLPGPRTLALLRTRAGATP